MLAIFEYMSSDAIVLGNNTWPKVMGRDQNTFEEWDKEEITLRKLSVIDKMLHEVWTGKTSVDIWNNLKVLHEAS